MENLNINKMKEALGGFSFFLLDDFVIYTLFFPILIDIAVAHIVVDDELRCPPSIEDSAENNTCDFVVRHFLHGCNPTKHRFGYFQSSQVGMPFSMDPHFYSILDCVIFTYFNTNRARFRVFINASTTNQFTMFTMFLVIFCDALQLFGSLLFLMDSFLLLHLFSFSIHFFHSAQLDTTGRNKLLLI